MASNTFWDYKLQIQNLKNKHLIVEDDAYAIEILNKIGYYVLINGYKNPFKNPNTNKYFTGTTFNDIYQLYIFDANLRETFFKYILTVEQHIKSSISYHFSGLYGCSMVDYQNLTNYDYGSQKKQLQLLFQKLNDKLTGSHASPQVKHHLSLYKDVPLWVLSTEMTFGETATMYRFLKGHCKTLVCNDFGQIRRAELGKMLILLTKARNICAHGNRLYNFRTQDNILDCTVHQKLKIPKVNSLYMHGKSDLFAVVIALKYLLAPKDFETFYFDMRNLLKIYSSSYNVLPDMGFPSNWSSILKISV